MQLSELLIPTFTQALKALGAWLAKGAAHEEAAGREPDGLLSGRIAPDMFPLATQIRFGCFSAQEFAYWLRGEPLPDAVLAVRQAGRDAAERPGTMADAQAQIAAALEFLSQLDAAEIDARAGRQVTLELPTGHVFEMTGDQYARDWALPQFYFHLIAAYAILRGRGVPLGKVDYLPHMFAYLRPGSGPA
ncbi:MAG: DUF1993 family protein [Sphingomonas sp.]